MQIQEKIAKALIELANAHQELQIEYFVDSCLCDHYITVSNQKQLEILSTKEITDMFDEMVENTQHTVIISTIVTQSKSECINLVWQNIEEL